VGWVSQLRAPVLLFCFIHEPHVSTMTPVRVVPRVVLAPLRLNQIRTQIPLRALSTVVETSSIASSVPPLDLSRTGKVQLEQDAQRQQQAKRILQEAVAATAPRHNWTRDEVAAIYYQPVMELAFQAVSITFLAFMLP
jgi:hypothetical protein